MLIKVENMSFEVSYIIAPLLGGIIGYITNDIVIWMLFRPHKSKYLLGLSLSSNTFEKK